MESTKSQPFLSYDHFQPTVSGTLSKKVKPAPKYKCLHSTTHYLQILFSNLGICALLVGYTLLGSFIFLLIEGGGHFKAEKAVNRTLTNEWTDEFRSRTVENIWDITVSLNILYRENWTKLAAQEITKFQDDIIDRLYRDLIVTKNFQERQFLHQLEWNFARAFLYSLTVITTIGYGGFTPRTSLGKAVTMLYALIGIPLMLLYLSSVGSVLSKCARGVCSRALCCCLCSNCGYCCYDEKRMLEKEKRMKKRRELEEMQQIGLQEPFYVKSSSSIAGITSSSISERRPSLSTLDDVIDLETTGSILAPLGLCLMIMFLYILGGTVVLIRLESWTFLDSCYFCFMSLSTINLSEKIIKLEPVKTMTLWFCSIYILTGLALTAMCFNILHEELLKRLKKQLLSGYGRHRKDDKKEKNLLENSMRPDIS